MNGNDLLWLCLAALALLCGAYGLHRISRQSELTEAEYEERLRKGSGIARGAMNSGFYAIQQWLHPKAAEAVAVQKDLREGYYDSQQTPGDDHDEEKRARQPL
ncbi:MAG TPA: hypothetical protein VN256_00530 [Pyrinomonadaceae bacterium]|nr:hypothetical protein [Pyrinomonadaceae bacterium]